MREIASPSLGERTTLRLGGNAIAELIVENFSDLEKLPPRLASLGGQPFYLGRGSNILAQDGQLPLVLIRVDTRKGIEIAGRVDNKVLVRVQAGEPLKNLLRFCLKNGLSGLEGLTGIPGSTGGAVAMNAGSFGVETAALIHSVTAWDDGGLRQYKYSDLLPEYRNLRIAGQRVRPLFMEVIFALTPTRNNVIFTRMNLNFLKKKSRQPLSAWSAGCAFKNPPGQESAGKLLEAAGLRGKRLGGMAFSAMHANFLVNEGRGTSTAAFDLLADARERVFRNSGICLEPEVRIIPCPLG